MNLSDLARKMGRELHRACRAGGTDAPRAKEIRAALNVMRSCATHPAAVRITKASKLGYDLAARDQRAAEEFLAARNHHCPDCGERGERAGHQTCRYPQDH